MVVAIQGISLEERLTTPCSSSRLPSIAISLRHPKQPNYCLCVNANFVATLFLN